MSNTNTQEAPGRKWLSPVDAAEALGLARISVYKMIRDGQIPSIRLGGKRLIPASFLDALEQRAYAAVDAEAGSEGR